MRLATLNITDARNARLNAALRCFNQMNIDVGILTETKLSGNRYTRCAEGYNVIATSVDEKKGGVAIIYRKSEAFGIEDVKCFGPNVIRATLVSGRKRWLLVGTYVPPSEENGETLDWITQAAQNRARHCPLILLDDLNVDLDDLSLHSHGAERRVETASLVSMLGLNSLRNHFRQRRGLLNKYWTWTQIRGKVKNGVISLPDLCVRIK